jgi:hypothetical protein
LAGAAPYGEDLTVVVVGGGERQPVPNPLEPVQRKAAVAFKKTKHILRAAEFLRDLVARDVIVLEHAARTVMLADLLTIKAVARAMFVELMRLMDEYAQSGCLAVHAPCD